jgi:hypothetical protein
MIPSEMKVEAEQYRIQAGDMDSKARSLLREQRGDTLAAWYETASAHLRGLAKELDRRAGLMERENANPAG